MKANLKHEYVLIVSLSLLLLILVNFSNMAIIRTMLGLPYTLFIPGYLLTVTLFPRVDDLDFVDRIALSMGLSIIIVPLLGMLQNHMSLGIRLFPMMISVTFLNIVFAVLGWNIRKKLPEEERFLITLKVGSIDWQRSFKEATLVHMALLISCLALFITILYILLTPKVGTSFTEFYITGQVDIATGYPEQLQAGDYGVIRACVINHEQQEAVYRMEIRVDGAIIQTVTPISLEHLEKWERAVYFKLTKPNDAAKVEFLLFKDSQSPVPYRRLRLWINVLPATNAELKIRAR